MPDDGTERCPYWVRDPTSVRVFSFGGIHRQDSDKIARFCDNMGCPNNVGTYRFDEGQPTGLCSRDGYLTKEESVLVPLTIGESA